MGWISPDLLLSCPIFISSTFSRIDCKPSNLPDSLSGRRGEEVTPFANIAATDFSVSGALSSNPVETHDRPASSCAP